MSQTPRQIMKSVLAREAPERFPTTASVFAVTSRKAGYTLEQYLNLEPEEQALFEYNAAKEYSSDFLSGGLSGTLVNEALGGNVNFRAHGSPDVTEPLIANIADLDKIDIARIRQYPRYQKALASAKYLFELGNGEYNNYLNTWGVFTMAALFYGEANLMRACIRDKPAVFALLDFALEVFKFTQDEFVDAGVSIGACADPSSSGDMISKRVFEEFSAPYLLKTFDWYATI